MAPKLSEVWGLPIPPTEKLLLLAMAYHCRDGCEVWPSNGRLAGMTGLHRDTVKSAKARLLRKGVIAMVDKKRGKYSVTLTSQSSEELDLGYTPPAKKGGGLGPPGVGAQDPHGGGGGPPGWGSRTTTEGVKKNEEGVLKEGAKRPHSVLDISKPVGKGGLNQKVSKTVTGKTLHARLSRFYRDQMAETYDTKVLTLTSKQSGMISQFIKKFGGNEDEAEKAFHRAIVDWHKFKATVESHTGEKIKAAVPQLGLILKFATEAHSMAGKPKGEFASKFKKTTTPTKPKIEIEPPAPLDFLDD